MTENAIAQQTVDAAWNRLTMPGWLTNLLSVTPNGQLAGHPGP